MVNSLLILFFGVLFHCTTRVIPCGSGAGTSRGRIREHNIKGTRLPDVSETSHAASGTFEGAKHRTDPRLVPLLSTDIVFEDKSYNADSRRAIKICRDSIIRLARVVKRFWKGRYKILVLEGFVAYGEKGHHFQHGQKSLHFSGRAFDISLVDSPDNDGEKLGDKVPTHTLRTLAGLAYYNAQFTFVQLRRRHLHVSCGKTGQGSSPSRCFKGSSFVRTSNHERKQVKDLQVGDEVLTMSSDERPTFSKVTMLMHHNPNQFVEDFIKITTSHGKQITLSSYHMIYTLEEKYVFAKDVHKNQTVMVYDESSHTFGSSIVQKVSLEADVGIYAPLTDEGTIVVDDVFASCYALFPSHRVSHAVFWVWRRLIYPFWGKSFGHVEHSEYHWYPDMFRRSLNYLGIMSYSL